MFFFKNYKLLKLLKIPQKQFVISELKFLLLKNTNDQKKKRIKYYLTYIIIKNVLYVYVNIINYIPYKIETMFVWINKIYLCVRTNLVIYVIVLLNFFNYSIYIYYLIICKRIYNT